MLSCGNSHFQKTSRFLVLTNSVIQVNTVDDILRGYKGNQSMCFAASIMLLTKSVTKTESHGSTANFCLPRHLKSRSTLSYLQNFCGNTFFFKLDTF